MEAQNEAEYRELLFLNRRLLIHTDMVNSFRDNRKALKSCEKLIKIELNSLKKSRTPVSEEELHALIWRYADFAGIVKRLRKTDNASVYGKAVSDLDCLIGKTNDEISGLEEKLFGQTENGTENSDGNAETDLAADAKELVTKLGEAAKKVAEKVSYGAKKLESAVSGQVEKIKKTLAGDGNCE